MRARLDFDDGILRFATDRRPSRPLELAPLPTRRSSNPRVELRLTANLQLRRHRNPRAAPPGRSPKSPLATSNARSGWSLDRRPLRALLPGAWPLRPRAEHAASPLTSSSTTAPLDPASRPDPRLPPLGSVPAIPSSKTTASPKPGRLPSTSALSSVSLSRCPLAPSPRQEPVITESPPPYPRLSPGPASNVSFTLLCHARTSLERLPS